MQDISKGEAVGAVISRAKELVEYITNHTIPQAIYQKYKAELRVGKGLVKPNATRFATNVLMLEALEANK